MGLGLIEIDQKQQAVQLEVHFLAETITRQVPVPLSEERCEDLRWWFEVHEARRCVGDGSETGVRRVSNGSWTSTGPESLRDFISC